MILVTHQLQFLDQADKICYVNDGNVQVGSYADFEHMDFLTTLKKQRAAQPSTAKLVERSVSTISDFNEEVELQKEDDSKAAKPKRSTSEVFQILWSYFRTGVSTQMMIFALFIMVSNQYFDYRAERWLGTWTEKNTNLTGYDHSVQMGHAMSYCSLLGFSVIFSMLRDVIVSTIGIRCGRVLHNDAFSAVLRSPMAFFEKTSVGTIVTRLTSDMAEMDWVLPLVISSVAFVSSKIFALDHK